MPAKVIAFGHKLQILCCDDCDEGQHPSAQKVNQLSKDAKGLRGCKDYDKGQSNNCFIVIIHFSSLCIVSSHHH